MTIEVKLPPIADGVDKGDVAAVHVKPGDIVKADDPLIEVESDKATIPVPAPADGRVARVLVKQGDKIRVGQLIVELEQVAAAVSGAAAPPASAEPVKPLSPGLTPREDRPIMMDEPPPPSPLPPVQTAPPPGGLDENQHIPAGPAVRRIARELGIDLRRVRGSGRNGRITVEDLDPYIRQYVAARGGVAPSGPAFAPVELPDFSQWGPVRSEKASTLRVKIADKLAQAWATVPHVHHHHEADITGLAAMQKRYKDRVAERGASLTLTPFLLKALVIALKEFPVFNASYDAARGEIIYKDYYHIGVAVDTDAGLIVPVVRDVDKKTIMQLAADLADLSRRTRERKVTPDELRGGTFTLSNLGGIGGGHFNPIINTPEVAILGTGRAVQKPVFAADGSVQARLMMPLTLGYDHRVIDGADGARFLVRLVDILENFEATILGF
ncbi:MAG: 2-oxo acid dehydrogenase subunit E2 [Candidatus Sumerlaeaceae bacterium]|nr:2-oxo acid dehydrogenase subunit E2 [Candidatus Sumerlaeaceae bacterium]